MKILVTNDDGIEAPGLWALVGELARAGEVIVFAPSREQSGIGTAITLKQPVRLEEVEPLVAGVSAYRVEGTPADSVILGLEVTDGVDMVFSGINRGSNLGNDVLLSGTVGGALQGYLKGLPSVAISVDYSEPVHFEVAAKLAGLLAHRIRGGSMLLNVNLPNVDSASIRGLEITRVGRGGYSTAFRMGQDGAPGAYRIALGKPDWTGGQGTDIQAVRQGKISITPLKGTLSSARKLPALDGSLPALLRELVGGDETPLGSS
ncbi:MAG: 5'/3'-nucleotidase SurE [Chloroflexi bacterium]|nr:MAG: 5'/3'-nucleotidase SurE [Chloroflexota bacterium]RLC97360.1 MAG: 5'/3'-nucleotidase SurE [Chloroflexota bacterium]